MSLDRLSDTDPAVQRAITELKDLIRTRYPSAEFLITRGEEPVGVYLQAIVVVEDTEKVVDPFIDRMLVVQIEERLPVYGIPVRPPARVAELMHRRQGTRA